MSAGSLSCNTVSHNESAFHEFVMNLTRICHEYDLTLFDWIHMMFSLVREVG